MTHKRDGVRAERVPLERAAPPDSSKVLNPSPGGFPAGAPVALVILAAGKGTRFGTAPKCVQPVRGVPLARHSIDAFRRLHPAPCICLVGYAHEEVMGRLGADNTYVLSANPAGGTAFAAFEALGVTGLEAADPLLVITMGDRVVPESVFRRLLETHRAGDREADLTLLSVRYVPPAQHGKGRILRGASGRIERILEQRDIDAIADPAARRRYDEITEGNCPLYIVRARGLRRLGDLHNDNAQGQYYITDLVARIAGGGGDVRTVTVTEDEPEYALLCSDVTRPADLARLESLLAARESGGTSAGSSAAAAAEAIAADRSPGQTASIAAQLREIHEAAVREGMGFDDDRPAAIGISGGRLRIAFMHPDMGRFYGPAWQMPTGAADAAGRQQIALVAQGAEDGHIRHFPAALQFREKIDAVPAANPGMYPGEDIDDLYKYEEFGTRMAERLLLSLGYFSEQELHARRGKGLPLPPPSLWVANNMRRPFSLICNAIASMRTLRRGPEGERVQQRLGMNRFRGLRIASTGAIPRGGFSSSSALTVAVKNAINVLYGLGIPPDTLVHLACQAEYGTGVRAGSLDQATEQKGKHGQGALISSNPRDNYRTIGVFPVPADRFRMLFPFSVDRDREAWRWSGGAYAADATTAVPTTTEMRKLTGKAAEMAAILTRLSLHTDFFALVEEDLVRDGEIGPATRARVCGLLRALPLCVPQDELRVRLMSGRDDLAAQWAAEPGVGAADAAARADVAIAALFAGWRTPRLRRGLAGGTVVEEDGVPLRAMVAYLFLEVARCFRMIRHPEEWIASVTRSQRGDRSFVVDSARLPPAEELVRRAEWERGLEGPPLLDAWLERAGAVPFDFNRGLSDADLDRADGPAFADIEGGSFFRGLALLDLVEAMLKRAFGDGATAIRVNAAGQGDYFQVHIDTTRAEIDAVKDFIRRAFYQRFGLAPALQFVEPHPGGGAVGVRIDRFDMLPDVVRHLEILGRVEAHVA